MRNRARQPILEKARRVAGACSRRTVASGPSAAGTPCGQQVAMRKQMLEEPGSSSLVDELRRPPAQ
jgi:hypothetical protein